MDGKALAKLLIAGATIGAMGPYTNPYERIDNYTTESIKCGPSKQRVKKRKQIKASRKKNR